MMFERPALDILHHSTGHQRGSDLLFDGWYPGDMLEYGYFQNFKRDFPAGALA